MTIAVITESDYMNMNLRFAYRYMANWEIMSEMHTHTFYEYTLVISGSIMHYINGTQEILNAGDFMFIRKFDEHQFKMFPNRKCELVNISFSEEYLYDTFLYLGDSLQQILLSPKNPPKLFIPDYSLTSFIQKHDFFNFHITEREQLVKFKILLLDILSKFLLRPSTFLEPGTQKLSVLLEQMNTRENIEEGMSAMLRITGFSHGHLCRIMKEEMHTTPIQYLTDLRMAYASSLLTNSNMDILAISLKVGYTSLSHFITLFKKTFGTTPLKYRQAHQSSTLNIVFGKK